MSGFFDIIFGQSEPEPPKPKKAKKDKKVKKVEKVEKVEKAKKTEKSERTPNPFMGMIKGMQTRIDELEARTSEPEPEPESKKIKKPSPEGRLASDIKPED